MSSLTPSYFCSLTVLPSRMTCETFQNLVPHLLPIKRLSVHKNGDLAEQVGHFPFNRTVATSATAIQLSKPAGGNLGFLPATGSGDTDSPTAPKGLKENSQPLKLSTVVVFFLLSTVFPELTGTPYFKGVGGFSLCFPALFYVSSFSLIKPLGWNLFWL